MKTPNIFGIIFVVITAFLAVLLTYSMISNNDMATRYDEMSKQLEESTGKMQQLNDQQKDLTQQTIALQAELDKALQNINDLENQITELDYQTGKYKESNESLQSWVNQFAIFDVTAQSQLAKDGVTDLEALVIEIKAQKDLITFEPVLGGTFFISDVKLINNELAFATCEDGHILGYMLIRYTVKDGKLDKTKAVFAKLAE